MEKLMLIQSELKAPKGQFNAFGKYKYRNCEDILEAVKPLLAKNKCHLTFSDKIIEVCGRVYVEATVILTDIESRETVQGKSSARESETRKGMDDAQITGATSSYARKYALNGLFCIDDTKDSDTTNTHGKGAVKSSQSSEVKPQTTQQAQRISQDVISTEGQKMIRDLAKVNGWSETDFNASIGKLGYKNIGSILKQDYTTIVDTFSKPKSELEKEIQENWAE